MLKFVLGGVLLALSLPFVAMAIVDLATGGDGKTGSGVLVGIAIFFSGVAAGGGLLIRSARRAPAAGLSPPSLEVLALRTASAMGGTLGAAQLASAAGVPYAEAYAVLQKLRAEGACQVLVEASGAELYRFPDVALGPEGTARAKDLLE